MARLGNSKGIVESWFKSAVAYRASPIESTRVDISKPRPTYFSLVGKQFITSRPTGAYFYAPVLCAIVFSDTLSVKSTSYKNIVYFY